MRVLTDDTNQQDRILGIILRVIIPDNGFERRGFRERMRGEPSRHDGSLNTALRESTRCPVAGDRQIVIRIVER